MANDAFEIAKKGGKHHKWYLQQLSNGPIQLRKGIRSLQKQVDQHKQWIYNPSLKVADWENRSDDYQKGLLSKWQLDINRHQEHIAILRGVLKDMGHDNE